MKLTKVLTLSSDYTISCVLSATFAVQFVPIHKYTVICPSNPTHTHVWSSGSTFSLVINSLKILIGPLTVLPYSNSNGEYPKLSCLTSLCEYNNGPTYPPSLSVSQHTCVSACSFKYH